MAKTDLTITISKDEIEKMKQAFRDVLILEYGEYWEEYCFENNIPCDIKLGFLDYLNDKIN